MIMQDFDVLRLYHQLCFPLYACSKEVIRRYKPYLDPLGLTYTQYIVLLVLWERREITVKALGESLYLDSGTLTPVLKKLESKGYIRRSRSQSDERSVVITLTEQGLSLREAAREIPLQMGQCVGLPLEDAAELHRLLHKLMAVLTTNETES